MTELEASLRYVPTYQVIEKIRQEEKKIAKDKIQAANDKVEQVLSASIHFLTEKDISVKQIAEILGITVREVNRILKKGQ